MSLSFVGTLSLRRLQKLQALVDQGKLKWNLRESAKSFGQSHSSEIDAGMASCGNDSNAATSAAVESYVKDVEVVDDSAASSLLLGFCRDATQTK